MSNIERLLTELTPLPLDIIRFCVKPYLKRERQWKNAFAHVLDDIDTFGYYRRNNGGNISAYWIVPIFNNKTTRYYHYLCAREHEKQEMNRLGRIEY